MVRELPTSLITESGLRSPRQRRTKKNNHKFWP